MNAQGRPALHTEVASLAHLARPCPGTWRSRKANRALKPDGSMALLGACIICCVYAVSLGDETEGLWKHQSAGASLWAEPAT